MTLLIASMALLGIRSAAAVVMVDFDPAPPIPVAFGDMFDVDVVVSGLGGDIVSAYDVDITYDPFLLLPGAVSFAGELGLPDIETITGNFDLFGILDVFEVSLLSDAELGALQNGSEVTLFTVSFEALDDGEADLGFIWDDFNDVKGGENEVVFPPAAAIPEPATTLLLGVGLAAIGVVRRRKRG